MMTIEYVELTDAENKFNQTRYYYHKLCSWKREQKRLLLMLDNRGSHYGYYDVLIQYRLEEVEDYLDRFIWHRPDIVVAIEQDERLTHGDEYQMATWWQKYFRPSNPLWDKCKKQFTAIYMDDIPF